MVPLLLAALSGCIFDEKQAKGGSVVENEVLGALYAENGDPAANAEVKAYPVGHVPNKGLIKAGADSIVVYTFRTDGNGRFATGKMREGQYNFFGEQDGAYSLLDSVIVDQETDSIPSDTLKKPGAVYGIIVLEPNHDRKSAYVQVLGTDRFVTADSAGRFVLEGLAAGRYSIRVMTTYQNYTPYFGSILARPGKTDTLASPIRPVFTGIPVVRRLRIAYDTAKAEVTVSWDRPSFSFLKEFTVYRSDAANPAPAILPIARVADTFYVDRLSETAQLGLMTSTGPIVFDYRVKIRNQSDEEGLAFGSISVTAAPTGLVTTRLDIAGVEETGLAGGPGDTLAVRVHWENPTRKNKTLSWQIVGSGTAPTERAVSGMAGKDTFDIVLPMALGASILRVSITDEAGSIWSSEAPLSTVAGQTLVSVSPDTTVTILDRVELRGRAGRTFGSIVKREWDIGATGSFQASNTGDTGFIAGSAPGTLLCVFRATDDEGKEVLDTVRVAVIADLPTADAGADMLLTVGDTLILAGVGRDGLGSIVKWEWNLGPQGAFVEAPAGRIEYVSPSVAGLDSLILRVTDDDGNVAASIRVVTVVDDEPAITLKAVAQTMEEGGGYRITSTVADLGRIVKWEWNLGPNGAFVTGSKGDTVADPTEPLNGSFACKLRVTDEDGHTALKSVDLTVSRWKFLARHSNSDESYLVGGADGWVYAARKNQPEAYIYKVPTHPGSFGSGGYDGYNFQVQEFIGIGPVLYAIGGAFSSVLYSKTPVGGMGFWINRSTLPTNFVFQTATAVSSRIHATGMHWETNSLNLYDYDAQLDAWTKKSPAPLALTGHSTVGLDGKLYLTGGKIVGWPGESNRLFVFDPAKNEWDEKAPSPLAQSNFWLVAAKGRIYMGGNGYHVYEYDPVGDVWTEKSILLFPAVGKNAAAIDGKIYVVDRGKIQMYDPAEDP